MLNSKSKILKVIIAVLILSLILNVIFTVGFFYSLNRENTTWNMNSISYDVAKSDVELSAWIEKCNESEKGIYVLRDKQYNDDRYITSFYVYRTDKIYTKMDASLSVRYLKKEILNIIYSDSTDESTEVSDVLFFQAYSKKGYIGLNILYDDIKETFTLNDIGIKE